jgi:hypothetical protein
MPEMTVNEECNTGQLQRFGLVKLRFFDYN